jgi:hypothetical protein
VGSHLPMKHHAYAVAVASQWKRPPRLNVMQRKRCIAPPRDGREVVLEVLDFQRVIEAAPMAATWRPLRAGFSAAPAFAGL